MEEVDVIPAALDNHHNDVHFRGRCRHPTPDGKEEVSEVFADPYALVKELAKTFIGSRLYDAKRADELAQRTKAKSIERALSASPPDIQQLKRLALSRGGLLNDQLRMEAWPLIVGVDVSENPQKPDEETLHAHRDYNQVVLDVNRSAKRFPPGMEENVRLSYQDQLVDTIMRILVHQPDLHYFQGYHDIVVTFLLVVGEENTFALMNKLSKAHFKDFMGPNLDETVRILSYLFPLIGCANKELRKFIESTQVSNIFSLSWLMTWFSHVLNNFKDILRLYDFFLASHPYMPIYLAAATVLHRENEILPCEPDEMFVHPLLAKIPDDIPWELLCSRAQNLFVLYPPEEVVDEATKCYELTQQRKRPMPSRRRERPSPISRQMWLWLKARSFSNRGILYHVTVWTLVAAVTAAAYTYYVGQSLEDFDDSVKVSLSNAR